MEWNIMRLRYLFYLDKVEKDGASLSGMARVFGVSKSTISRNLEVFAENGIVHNGTLNLTGHGRGTAEKYKKEVEGLRVWLSDMTGKSPEDMTSEAMQMLLTLSEETRQSIIEKQKIKRAVVSLAGNTHPKAGEVQKILKSGTYHLPFTIYKENMEGAGEEFLSMADMGFEHPARLVVESGTSMICLKAVALESRSIVGELLLRGKLLRMKYRMGKEYVEARQEGDSFYFPMSALIFSYHKEEGMLQGSTKLLLESPMMKKKNHSRAAVFTMFLQ